jgi:hypothetical protein
MKQSFRPSPNSFKNTFCVFHEVPLDAIDGLEVQYASKAGSSYYYTKEGMYRLSNHWGRLANSKWRLEPMQETSLSKQKLGFALWTSFYPDNAEDKLYYLEANFDTKTLQYQHKNNPAFDQKAVLRTSFETAKRIKQARNLLELTSWAKYFENDDIDSLRMKIMHELIYTEKSLEEIKREQR